MQVAFLGLGKMGRAIAGHLLKAGHTLTVWNRTRAHAETMAEQGATVANSPAEAVSGAEVVFSMVMDDAALEEIVNGAGLLKAMRSGGIHVSLSTISVKLSKELTEAHRSAGQHFVGSPVFGRPNVAEDGKLWTVAAGEPEVIAKIRPLLETFSRGVTIVSEEPSSAHALKLGGNFLITAMIASLSEGFIYADALGIEPKIFMETINNALFRSPFYEAYGKIMLDPPEVPGGTIALGEKDMRLFREAAATASVATPLGDVFEAHLLKAIEAGMKNEDWAGGYYHLAQGTAVTGD